MLIWTVQRYLTLSSAHYLKQTHVYGSEEDPFFPSPPADRIPPCCQTRTDRLEIETTLRPYTTFISGAGTVYQSGVYYVIATQQ